MNLQWFENIVNELSRNPQAATEQITLFRDEDIAHSLCMQFLHETQLPLVQFQVLTILQYTTIKNWNRFTAEDCEAIRICLWSKIMNNHSEMKLFILNKAYQLFALTWKCGWSREPINIKESLFQSIQSNLINANTIQTNIAASEILRAVVEEFANRSSAQIGAPLEFHRQAHVAFEEYGLDQVLQLSLQLLSSAISAINTTTTTGSSSSNGGNSDNTHEEMIQGIKTTSLLLESVLQWDFGCPDLLKSDSDVVSNVSRNKISIPSKWVEYVISPEMVSAVSTVHNTLITKYSCNSNITFSNHIQTQAGSACNALWQLLLAFGSITPNCGTNDTFRTALGEAAAAYLEACADPTGAMFIDNNNMNDQISNSSSTMNMSINMEMRSSMCQEAVMLTSRLISTNNVGRLCSLPIFDKMLYFLCKFTNLISQEMHLLSSHGLKSQTEDGGSLISSLPGVSWPTTTWNTAAVDPSEPMLDGWRGDLVTILLDTWSLLLDDPALMRCPSPSNSSHSYSNSSSNGNGGEKSILHDEILNELCLLSGGVFKSLFETVQCFCLSDAIDVVDEDEDEVVEEIERRNLDEFIRGICALGRVDIIGNLGGLVSSINMIVNRGRELFVASKQHYAGTTHAHGQNNKALEMQILQVQESLRVSSIFASWLLMDVLAVEGRDVSSEPPLVPGILLGDVLVKQSGQLSSEILTGADGVVNAIGGALSLMLDSLIQQSSLYSPLVIKVILNFFSAYIRTYVDASISVNSDYNHDHKQHPALNAHHPEFNGVLEVILQGCYICISHIPLELEVIEAVANVISACSRLPHRVNVLLGLQPMQNIFALLTLPSNSTSISPPPDAITCRLNPIGLSLIWSSIAAFATRTNSHGTGDALEQLCQSALQRMHFISSLRDNTNQPQQQLLQQQQQQRQERKQLQLQSQLLLNARTALQIRQCISILGGLARAPGGRADILGRVMAIALPQIAWCVQVPSSVADELLLPSLTVCKDFAERHITALASSASSSRTNETRSTLTTIYSVSCDLLVALTCRISGDKSTGNTLQEKNSSISRVTLAGAEGQAWERDFAADVLLAALELLAALANQDIFESHPGSKTGQYSNRRLQQPVVPGSLQRAADILVFGLETLTPILTADLLREYPVVSETYFTFLQFMFSSLNEDVMGVLRESEPSISCSFLSMIIEQLLWATGAVNGLAARQALHCLQLLAGEFKTGRLELQMPIGMNTIGPRDMLLHCMTRLLEMIMLPDTAGAEYGLASNRIDSFARAFLSFVQIDLGWFETTATSLIDRQPEQHRQALIDCFGRLTTNNGVNIGAEDRANRHKFVLNMRTFVNDVRSLILYK